MPRLLEELEPGTPVFVGDVRVGDVRAVYAEGEARRAEYLCIRWEERQLDVLIPTSDVATLEVHGVILIGAEPATYANLVAFDPARVPLLRKLR